jgi:hypothetical protein
MMRQPSRYYFFLPEPKAACHSAPVFWLGAAAIVLIFSFLGFLACPIAFLIAFGHVNFSLGLMMTQNAEYQDVRPFSPNSYDFCTRFSQMHPALAALSSCRGACLHRGMLAQTPPFVVVFVGHT